MMKLSSGILFTLLFCTLSIPVFSQENEGASPLERAGFKKSTSYSDVVEYIDQLAAENPNFEVTTIGNSVQTRKIQMIHVVPATNGNKIKVLLFCQQHGNEPAGKETALLLLKKIAAGAEDSFLSNIDLYIIPLVNPDGNEEGKRANANGEDLNRDHLLLTQPEVRTIHEVFSHIDPEVTLDIHEYSAFRKEFRNAGYVRTDDEEFGAPTNPNISPKVRDFALRQFFPFLEAELAKQGVSFSNYYKMDSPDDTVRASTNAIGDGRQSLAILGSLSFILEGRGGRDMNSDLKRRVSRQLIAVENFLKFVNGRNVEIQSLVASEKKRIMESTDPVALQMDYVCDGSRINMHMQMLDSGIDTVMQLPYASTVKVLESVTRPQAYLVPKALNKVIEFLDLHGIYYIRTKRPVSLSVEIYSILDKTGAWMENKTFKLPRTAIRTDKINTEPGDIIVPLNLRTGLMTVIAFEPASMWGLMQTEEFRALCRKGNDYPILRVPEFKGTKDE